MILLSFNINCKSIKDSTGQFSFLHSIILQNQTNFQINQKQKH